MSIKILIITHGTIGEAILNATIKTYGSLPIPTKVIPVYYDSSLESVMENVRKELQTEPAENTLVITDLFGSTPTNLATQICKVSNVKVITGLNLPMLMRIMNYPKLPLDELINKAINGGKNGISLCD